MAWKLGAERGRFAAALAGGLAEWLPGFLPRQRWFGGRTRAIQSAALDDLAWIDGEAGTVALAIVRVTYVAGAFERYAMLLGGDDTGAQPALCSGVSLAGTGEGAVADCALHPPAAWSLIRGLAGPGSLATFGSGRLVFGDMAAGAEGALEIDRLSAEDVRGIGGEQSNTSLRIGSGHVFKLFRKLESGEHPELEIGRFLTGAGFAHAPALRGSVTWMPADGPPTSIGVLQDLVPNVGDGWTWAKARLVGGGPADAELRSGLGRLGAITGAMHVALASDPAHPDFAPEPVTDADLAAWRTAAAEQARRALELIERLASDLPEPARTLAVGLAGRRERLLATTPLADPPGDGAFTRIRIHGDYHLGQTLRTGDDFMVIDFEGEPARPLGERRAKHCALRDVAGMLRSLDYALTSATPGGMPARADREALRATFLDGYHTGTGAAAFLPRDPRAACSLARFFELDRALYEAEYELNHRPDWAHVPLAGITRLTEGHAP